MAQQILDTVGTGDTIQSGAVKTNANFTELYNWRGSANGVAPLDSNALIPQQYLPAIAISNTYVVSTQAAMLALTAQTGDICVRTDTNETYILSGTNPSVLAEWTVIHTPTNVPVQSVAGRTGNITLTVADLTDAGTSATKNVAAAGDAAAGEVVMGNDSRLVSKAKLFFFGQL